MDQLTTHLTASNPSASEREAPDLPTQLASDSIVALQERIRRLAQEAPAAPTEEQQRQQEADALTGYLARLGFPRENWEPEWSRLPEGWAARTRAYHLDLPRYVNSGIGMILSGLRGSGKSCLLALLARAAKKHEIDCAYVLDGRTLLYQCQLIDRKQEARAGAYDALGEDTDLRKHWPHERTPLVLLDDLDYIPAGGYDPERNAWDVIGAYIYARMARGLATCIAANLTPDGLLGKPGMDRVEDRATVYLPDSLRLIAGRGTQRAAEQRKGYVWETDEESEARFVRDLEADKRLRADVENETETAVSEEDQA